MTVPQKLVIWLGCMLLIALFLYPPYTVGKFGSGFPKYQEEKIGHHSILAPPKDIDSTYLGTWRHKVDIKRTAIYSVVIVFAASTLVLALRRKPKK